VHGFVKKSHVGSFIALKQKFTTIVLRRVDCAVKMIHFIRFKHLLKIQQIVSGLLYVNLDSKGGVMKL